MTAATANPVHVRARIDAPLSRWLWLVKWLLVIPHAIALAFLWIAFAVLSVIAFVAILVTGRYPEPIFAFNLGVLRWSWRVAFYAAGAFGTDRYPPFSLGAEPDYPATLDIDPPGYLSRGLVLIKWWLLALPHYLVVAFFLGGGWTLYRTGSEQGGWQFGGGLIALLALIAGVVLLVTGRYPRGVFDLLLGLNRWVLRVAAYAALMTDAYPPFRLDLGGDERAALAVPAEPAPPPDQQPSLPPAPMRWTAGRVVTLVIGSLLVLGAIGSAAAGAAVAAADSAGRDAGGFVSTPARTVASSGYAVLVDAVQLGEPTGARNLGDVLGTLRVRASAGSPAGVFVGIAPAAAVQGWLGTVGRDQLQGMNRMMQRALPGGAPSTPPAQQTFWVASASGPGQQELTWTATEGYWSVVVMNADGSRPVTATVSAGMTAPVLRPVWIALFVGTGVGLVIGGVLIALAVPRRAG